MRTTIAAMLLALAGTTGARADTLVTTDQAATLVNPQAAYVAQVRAGGGASGRGGNTAAIMQSGTANNAGIDQAGGGNTALTIQLGTGNTLLVQQWGSRGFVADTQAGNGLGITVTQRGNAPSISITQTRPGR